MGRIKGDTGSLDYSLHEEAPKPKKKSQKQGLGYEGLGFRFNVGFGHVKSK